MRLFFTRKRLSMLFCAVGVALMGVDLCMTRNVFTHIGELMAASIFCFVAGLVLDRTPVPKRRTAVAEGGVADKTRP